MLKTKFQQKVSDHLYPRESRDVDALTKAASLVCFVRCVCPSARSASMDCATSSPA